jgi:hypothetical protein
MSFGVMEILRKVVKYNAETRGNLARAAILPEIRVS